MAIAVYLGTTNIFEVGGICRWRSALGFDFGCLCNRGIFEVPYSLFLKGQHEAATALGREPFESLPYYFAAVWRLLLPGLGIYFWFTERFTALVFVLALEDIMRKANIAVSSTKQAFFFIWWRNLCICLKTI